MLFSVFVFLHLPLVEFNLFGERFVVGFRKIGPVSYLVILVSEVIDFLLELSGELLDFKTSYVLFVLGTQGRMDFFLYPHLIVQVIILVSQKRYLREQSLLAGCWLLGD